MLVSDYWHEETQHVYLMRLGRPGAAPIQRFAYLLDTRSPNSRAPGGKAAHVHPFLAPDGKAAFFNSTESGTLQAYMIRGLAAL